MALTPKQRELVRHCVGLNGRSKSTYRNHFVTGVGCADHKEWVDMVAWGYAYRRAGSEISGGDDIFWVKRETAMFVREKNEHLSRDFKE